MIGRPGGRGLRRVVLAALVVAVVLVFEAWVVLLAEHGQAHAPAPSGSNIRTFGAALAWSAGSLSDVGHSGYTATSGVARALSLADGVAVVAALVIVAAYLAQRGRATRARA